MGWVVVKPLPATLRSSPRHCSPGASSCASGTTRICGANVKSEISGPKTEKKKKKTVLGQKTAGSARLALVVLGLSFPFLTFPFLLLFYKKKKNKRKKIDLKRVLPLQIYIFFFLPRTGLTQQVPRALAYLTDLKTPEACDLRIVSRIHPSTHKPHSPITSSAPPPARTADPP